MILAISGKKAVENMPEGRNSRGKKWLMEKIAEEQKRTFPLTLTVFFCIKYPAENALKLKGVLGAEPPGGVLGPKALKGAAGLYPPNDRHS